MTKRGGKGNPVIFGSRDDNVLEGTDRKDLIFGFHGDDILDGGAGNDILFGGRGHDWLFGGAGNDILFGSKGNDFLDGGNGNDLLLGGKGDDWLNYTLSENEGAKDYYDGGKGFDTLQLTLTSAELQLAQGEIDAFKAFLAEGSNKVFHFESFGLSVRDFEDLVIVELGGGGNMAPVAVDDSFEATEDDPIDGNVLANDDDADGDALVVSAVNGDSANVGVALVLASGALLTVNADGSFAYDPNGSFESLAAGQLGSDEFTYVAQDENGEDSNSATTNIAILGINDVPVANPDNAATDEDSDVAIDALANDTDVDSGATLTLVTVVVTAGGLGTASIVGDQIVYSPGNAYQFLGADESANVTISYGIEDEHGGAAFSSVEIEVSGLNDAPEAVGDAIPANEDAPATPFNVLDNDTDIDANDALSVVAVNGEVTNVGATITLASGALLSVGADGSVSFDPNGAYEALGVDESSEETFTYVVEDSQGATASATAVITIAGVNDAPIALNDAVPNTLSGPIKVAVIGNDGEGTNESSYLAAAAQLNPALFSATAIAHTASADWTATLKGDDDFYDYDVVVIGDDGIGADYTGSGIFAALADFVNAGGGVITTGWFATRLSEYSSTPDADYITPIASGTPSAANFGQPIKITDDAHPITVGIDNNNYFVDALRHDLAVDADTDAKVLAQWVPPGDGDPLVAIAVDEVGMNGGRTVFLGSLYMANDATYITSALRVEGSVGDQIFERAGAWAAGERPLVAATDEDTALVIDDEFLFANDSDIESDPLEFAQVMALSALGAAVSINGDGNVVYDPTVSQELQDLSAGDIVEDSFQYKVSDGQGGTSDWASVSLSVLGQADTIV